jgi:hypothetical protein
MRLQLNLGVRPANEVHREGEDMQTQYTPVELELLKAFLGLCIALVTILLSGVGVNWLTTRWGRKQKDREARATEATNFAGAYGEFFAIWKLWNDAVKRFELAELPATFRWEVLQRATNAEAKIESLLLSLAFTRKLSLKEQETLGRFRQGFQTLRERIREGHALEWKFSGDPEYSAFKELTCEVGTLVLSQRSAVTAGNAWLEVTSNTYESTGEKPWFKRAGGLTKR